MSAYTELMKTLAMAEEPGIPLPLFPPIPAGEPYPVDKLGPVIAPAAKAIANGVEVPISNAAHSVLAVATLAAQSLADVVLPTGQSRPLSLYFATVAASSDRKSTADEEAMWPIRKREQALYNDYLILIEEWKINHNAWIAEKRKAENGKSDGLDDRRAMIAAIGPEPEKPLEPLLVIAGDLTPEGLTKHWINYSASLGAFTTEGATFTAGHGMNDENRMKSGAVYSRLWGGERPDRTRADGGTMIIRGRRFSMHLMVQPDAGRTGAAI